MGETALAPWRAEGLLRIYRGRKRGPECVDDAEAQGERRQTIDEYKDFVRRIFRILCHLPRGTTPTRYEYKHSLRLRNPCERADIRLVIDVRPGATIEATFFEVSDATRRVPAQIAHAELTAAACATTVEALLGSVFPS